MDTMPGGIPALVPVHVKRDRKNHRADQDVDQKDEDAQPRGVASLHEVARGDADVLQAVCELVHFQLRTHCAI